MPVALFDLDNTLLGGDSDYLWGEYLVSIGAVDEATHRRENERFFADYQQGVLDVRAFLTFQLRPLAENDMATLLEWREQFVSDWIAPLVLEKGRALVADHRRRNHRVAIVTSTNAFITRPIAELFGIADLLATEPERRGDRYTGAYLGEPCSGAGKVRRVDAWARAEGFTLGESWFYSDSYQDLPLLSRVDHPVAVDPDENLREHAKAHDWPVLSLR